MHRYRVARASAMLAVAIPLALAGPGIALGAPRLAAEPATQTPPSAETTAPPPSGEPTAQPTPGETTATPSGPQTVAVGVSVKRRKITLVRFGSGTRRILIVGGIHGNEAGIPVARAFIAYLRAHPSVVPSGTQVDVLACANPDGYAKRQRGNARRVDLNRNFPSHTWRKLRLGRWTSGSRPSSEPETRALVKLLARRYSRVVSLHSKGGLVDGGGHGGKTLAKKVAKAAHMRYGGLPGSSAYPGSMGNYVPERYRSTAYVVWELSSTKMSRYVRQGLVVCVK